VKGFIAAHRAAVMVGVIVAAIAALTYLTIRAGTGTKAARPPATPATATTKALSGPAAELVRLVGRGQAVNIDVAYTATTATPSTFTAHLWRRGPLARLDNESGSGDGAVRTSQLVTASGPFSCTQTGSTPWSCVPKPDLRIGDVGVVSPALVSTLSALDVTVHDEQVLGQPARCFAVARPATSTAATVAGGDAASLCLSPDGIPVRLEIGPTRLEAVSLNRARPPDSIFKAPA